MLISLHQIGKSFAEVEVLRDVSFQINAGEKIGLVGRNGAGKTTLLRIIKGDVEPDRGQVARHPEVRVGFLEQIVRVSLDGTLFDEAATVFASVEELAREMEGIEAELEIRGQDAELQSLLDRYGRLQTRWEIEGGYSYKARTEAVLFGLGFSEKDLQRSATELSGGELNRLNLAKLLLAGPNLLLLDEPTNHLDIGAVRWLESFLQNYSNAYIVISHDRRFLDSTAGKIIEVAGGVVTEYPGNYSRYVEERERRHQLQRKAYQQQQEFIARTEEFIRRNIAGQKTKQAQSRRKMLEKLARVDDVPGGGSEARFRFKLNSQSGDLVMKVREVAIGYRDRVVARSVDFSLFRGQRIGIVGPNGSGKTTLLKTLLGQLAPIRGKVTVGQNVDVAYYNQQLSNLDPDSTVLEEIRSVAPLETDHTLRGFLASFLFRGDDVFQPVGSLSGGEKSRLSLAKLIYGKANTLMMDEPTNHLDIPSCEALEAALLEYPGTLIIVSHDRYLINKLVDRLIYLDGEGNSLLFEGTYAELEATLSSATPDSKTPTSEESEKPGSDTIRALPSNKLSKNEFNKLRSRCNSLEQEILSLEDELRVTLEQLNSPESAGEYQTVRQLSERHQDLSARVERLYAEWQQSLTLIESEVQGTLND